jgi:hypothetical protein
VHLEEIDTRMTPPQSNTPATESTHSHSLLPFPLRSTASTAGVPISSPPCTDSAQPFWHLRLSQLQYAILIVILLCGAALRLIPLPHEALEGDEVFSRSVVLLPVRAELAAIREDLVHPPLYYLLLQSTTRLWGTGAVGIRVLSLLSAAASALLLVLLGNILPNSRFAGLLAAAILAINQTLIFYSQQARSYSWYGLLALLLVAWVWRVTRPGTPPTLAHWGLGAILMTALVYTHYIGALYVTCAALAVLLDRAPLKTRLSTLACACIAALCFLPWLFAILAVYKLKHGLGANLDWQGHPTLYSLVQFFATAFGTPQVRAGTALVLLIIGFLSLMALLPERRPLRPSPILLTLFLMSFLPPLVVFVLSLPPINLPLFGIRHFLPSILAIILLCSYGCERLAQRFRAQQALIFSAAAAFLILITLVPSLHAFALRPTRVPYDRVSTQVQTDRAQGIPTYTTEVSFYGIGNPVNFYCASECVEHLPLNDHNLHPQFVLLYRAATPSDSAFYHQLQREGFSEILTRHYTHGGFPGISATLFKRVDTQPAPANSQ